MYVAVKGGEKAIAAAHESMAEARRGDPELAEISGAQLREQLALGIARIMAEGSLYDPDLAALALKQARGDMIEAIFLLRAYRTTLASFGATEPMDTAKMSIQRRISACFKDMPGGQVLGPTFDYTHRLLGETQALTGVLDQTAPAPQEAFPRIADVLGAEALIEPNPEDAGEPADLTRTPMSFPAPRDLRLQALARGDEGFLLSLAYSTQRGFGRTHPFVGEIRFGAVELEFTPPELGFAICLGEIELTECEMVNQFMGSNEAPPQFTRGYGLVFGQSERKAMSMALVDRALRTREFGEDVVAPAQDEEFVLSHADNVQATGFVEHLKLPHYVDFQAELGLLRTLRQEWQTKKDSAKKEHQP